MQRLSISDTTLLLLSGRIATPITEMQKHFPALTTSLGGIHMQHLPIPLLPVLSRTWSPIMDGRGPGLCGTPVPLFRHR